MFASLKIVGGVISYRLRNLEMFNLAAALSIALALRLPMPEVFCRTLFAFGLNVLIYLNNDYLDVEADLISAGKDLAKTRYLREHMRAALWAQLVLLALLVAASIVYDLGLLVPLATGGGICWWYTARLKRRPFTDVPAMMAWGMAMPLCGFPWHNALGWCLAAQLGLFSGVFESVQIVRDADDDAAAGIRTTGVVLGKARTILLARILMVICSLYALLVMHSIAALISALALALPITLDRMASYWSRVKMIYGIAWLFICGWVYLHHTGAGLVWSIASNSKLW